MLLKSGVNKLRMLKKKLGQKMLITENFLKRGTSERDKADWFVDCFACQSLGQKISWVL